VERAVDRSSPARCAPSGLHRGGGVPRRSPSVGARSPR
jgi:hypothetical protein